MNLHICYRWFDEVQCHHFYTGTDRLIFGGTSFRGGRGRLNPDSIPSPLAVMQEQYKLYDGTYATAGSNAPVGSPVMLPFFFIWDGK